MADHVSSKKASRRNRTKKSSVHYKVHRSDRHSWGTSMVCGKREPGTRDRKRVTCPICLRFVEWNKRRYQASCSRPLNIAEANP